MNTTDTWPKRPDGSNMSVGEMTPEQRRAVFGEAVRQTKRYFERPDVRAGIAAAMTKEIGT
jgi:hypothetical protein